MTKSHKKSRKPLGVRLSELAEKGGSGPEIRRRLVAEGYDISPATVGRRLLEIRGSQRVARRVPTTPPDAAPPPAGPFPSSDEEIEAADLSTLDQWLGLAARSAQAAEARGDAASVARFGALATSILEAKRKAAPKEEQPEGVFCTSDSMQSLADMGEKRFLKIIEAMFDEPGAP